MTQEELNQSLLDAVYSESLQNVELYLDRGANIEARNNKGKTPLMLAACFNSVPILKFLLDRNADINAQNETNDTALIWATAYKNFDSVKVLLENKANTDLTNSYAMNVLL